MYNMQRMLMKVSGTDALVLTALEDFIDCSFQGTCVDSGSKLSKIAEAVDGFATPRSIKCYR